MQPFDLECSMCNVRFELTQIAQDLPAVDNQLTYLLAMRQTQLLTQLQHLETMRWFSPQPVQSPQPQAIQVSL